MRNSFTYAGKSSLDFGIYTNGRETFGSPARSYETVQIPGRNGDLIYDNRRFENYDLKYVSSFIFQDFKTNIRDFRNYIASKHTYQRLEDTYNPEEYRMAIFKEAFEPDVIDSHEFGQFDIVFHCKPQRFLKSGEVMTEYTANSFTITNPTLFPAKPLIRVYGNGDLTIGGAVITIEGNADQEEVDAGINYIDLDFETMNAYRGTASKNRNISISTVDYPDLVPGVNNIKKSSTLTKIEVTPRWYII